jgi:ribosome maturation protein SDO1
LSEVLQVESVFTNVTSGKIANRAQLVKAFGEGVEQNDVILEILKKGQLQTTQAERTKQSESVLRDIATIVADKCVNADTNRPFTVAVIETAMRDIHYNLHPTRSAKQQALAVIPLLKQHIPIERAQMRLHIVVPENLAAKLKDKLKDLFSAVEAEEWSGDYEITGLLDPGRFRHVEELVAADTRGKGRVEVVDFNVVHEGSAKIVDETRRTDGKKATDDNDDDDDNSDADDDENKPAAAATTSKKGGANKKNDDSDESSDDEAAPAAKPKRRPAAASGNKQGGNGTGLSKEQKWEKRAEKTERQKVRRSALDKKRGGGDDERDGLPNEDDISL